MKSFVDFSRESFVEFCSNLAGFICYKNDANRVIYANRFGKVYKWSLHENEVSSKELTYPTPGYLSLADINWLKEIADKKRWKGGIAKLNRYIETSDEDLNKQGIDPYFYAWMASRHYDFSFAEKHTTEDVPAPVTKDEYEVLMTYMPFFQEIDVNSNIDGIVASFTIAKNGCDGISAIQWVGDKKDAKRRKDLRNRLKELVEEFELDNQCDAVEEAYEVLSQYL